LSFEAPGRTGHGCLMSYGRLAVELARQPRFVFSCSPAAVGLCAVEETARGSSEPPEEGKRACLRRTYRRATGGDAGVLDRDRVLNCGKMRIQWKGSAAPD